MKQTVISMALIALMLTSQPLLSHQLQKKKINLKRIVILIFQVSSLLQLALVWSYKLYTVQLSAVPTKVQTLRRKEQCKRNQIPIPNTAKASLIYDISPTATAAIGTGYVKDLIQGGILNPEHYYLALDKCKVQMDRTDNMKDIEIWDNKLFWSLDLKAFLLWQTKYD